MNQQEAILAAKPKFVNHSVDQFFVTSDGLVFFENENAMTHATKTLKDGQVFPVTRSESDAVNTDDPADMKMEDAKAKVASLKANLTAKNEEFDNETDETKLDGLEAEIKQIESDLLDAERALKELGFAAE